MPPRYFKHFAHRAKDRVYFFNCLGLAIKKSVHVSVILRRFHLRTTLHFKKCITKEIRMKQASYYLRSKELHMRASVSKCLLLRRSSGIRFGVSTMTFAITP